MFWQWLKRYLPHGLYGRAILILLVPIVTIQLVVSVVFIQRHFTQITRQMTSAVVMELGYLVRQVEGAETLGAARLAVVGLQEPLGMSVSLPSEAPQTDTKELFDFTGELVARTLRDGVSGITGVDMSSQPGRVRLGVDTRYGLMQIAFPRSRVSASNPHQLLVLMMVTALLMTLIAYLFLRNQLRPITRLARNAEAFGRGQVLPYRIAGATEVRAAGRAFLEMRARIERHIEQRTLMLSGVSHDLRTPITRLKLGLSMLPESDERAALERDIRDMERLVDEFLNFARSDALEGQVEEVDPRALLDRLVENATRGGQVVVLGPVAETGPIPLRQAAVMRGLENLLSNAARYGDRTRVSLEQRDRPREVHIVIEDDGPGIAPADRAEALKPFSRLDTARNQDKGSGVGLGLAIAADIARAHGGRIELSESVALGGLSAVMVLPY